MKINLLLGAALITSVAVSAPSATAKSAMDHNLKCLWMNTDVAPLHTSARQGVAVNGKFYLQNKDTQKIEIWNETGKIGELDSGKGTNIARDDESGKIMLRVLSEDAPTADSRAISPTLEDYYLYIFGETSGN